MLAMVASLSASFADVIGSCTGFLISNDGKIATDYAMVSNAKSIVVYGLEKSFSMFRILLFLQKLLSYH